MSEQMMKVARLYTAEDIRVEEAPIPVPGPGEALVRTKTCGICTGDIMGWYLERKAPLVFGHEPAGEIARLGEGVEGFEEGERVFVHHHAPCGSCRLCETGRHVHCPTWRRTNLTPGGMSEFFVVPAENLRNDTLKLPADVSFDAGSLIEPAACVVKSLKRGQVGPGDTVAIIGLGIMGQMHVVLAHAAGARVIGADMVPFRLNRALELGADAVVNVEEKTLAEGVREANGGMGADVVIVGPGSIEAMQQGIAAAGPGARVVLFTTSEPTETLSVLPHDLYIQEISIVPSYSCGPDDTREALEHVRSGVISEQELITHRFGIDRITDAYAAAARRDEALKTVVHFGE